MYKRKSYDLGDIREVMEYHTGDMVLRECRE